MFINYQIAQGVIRSHPYYFIVGYNCQSFVNDLAEKIAKPGFWNSTKATARRFLPWWLKPLFYRGEDDEEIPGTAPPKTAEEIKAEKHHELQQLEELVNMWGSGEGVTGWSPDDIDEPGPEEDDEQGLFMLKEQKYVQKQTDEDWRDLGEFGVVYDLTDAPAFKVAEIPVPEDPSDLTEEQHKILAIAQALVGEKKNIEE